MFLQKKNCINYNFVCCSDSVRRTKNPFVAVTQCDKQNKSLSQWLSATNNIKRNIQFRCGMWHRNGKAPQNKHSFKIFLCSIILQLCWSVCICIKISVYGVKKLQVLVWTAIFEDNFLSSPGGSWQLVHQQEPQVFRIQWAKPIVHGAVWRAFCRVVLQFIRPYRPIPQAQRDNSEAIQVIGLQQCNGWEQSHKGELLISLICC